MVHKAENAQICLTRQHCDVVNSQRMRLRLELQSSLHTKKVHLGEKSSPASDGGLVNCSSIGIAERKLGVFRCASR